MNKFSLPFMSKSPFAMHKGKPHKKVDPDAPGTPGKPGYEPEVKREELDTKGKEIYDNLRKENARLLKSGMTQEEIDAMRLKRHKEKKKKEQR